MEGHAICTPDGPDWFEGLKLEKYALNNLANVAGVLFFSAWL